MPSFSQGFAAGSAVRERRAQREREQQEKARAQRVRELEAQRKIRPLIDDAYKALGENPSALKRAVGDIFQAYALETETQVDPEIVKIFAEPEFGQQLLDTPATLGEIVSGGKQPLLRAQARIALAQREQARKAQEASVGGPAPTVGEPEQLAGPGFEAATAAATATGPRPNAALRPAIEAIDAQITDLEGRRAVMIRNNAAPQAYVGLDQQLKDLRERKAKLTEGPLLTGVEADIRRRAEATPPEIARETGALTRGELETRRPPLATPGELEAQKEAAQQVEREAGGVRKTIREQAEGARAAIPRYQRVAALLETAGRTGAVIGPLRQGIGQALQLVLPDTAVNRLMKLSDVELLAQANTELAIAGLKDVGGNDTERELLTLMQTKPGLLRTKQANRFATRWALAGYEQSLYRDQLADQWLEARRAEGKRPSLAARDAGGMTFNQRWDRYLANHPLYARVARDLGLDPVEFSASIGYDRNKAQRAFGGR